MLLSGGWALPVLGLVLGKNFETFATRLIVDSDLLSVGINVSVRASDSAIGISGFRSERFVSVRSLAGFVAELVVSLEFLPDAHVVDRSRRVVNVRLIGRGGSRTGVVRGSRVVGLGRSGRVV